MRSIKLYYECCVLLLVRLPLHEINEEKAATVVLLLHNFAATATATVVLAAATTTATAALLLLLLTIWLLFYPLVPYIDWMLLTVLISAR